jgi:hypothetical protein
VGHGWAFLRHGHARRGQHGHQLARKSPHHLRAWHLEQFRQLAHATLELKPRFDDVEFRSNRANRNNTRDFRDNALADSILQDGTNDNDDSCDVVDGVFDNDLNKCTYFFKKKTRLSAQNTKVKMFLYFPPPFSSAIDVIFDKFFAMKKSDFPFKA